MEGEANEGSGQLNAVLTQVQFLTQTVAQLQQEQLQSQANAVAQVKYPAFSSAVINPSDSRSSSAELITRANTLFMGNILLMLWSLNTSTPVLLNKSLAYMWH